MQPDDRVLGDASNEVRRSVDVQIVRLFAELVQQSESDMLFRRTLLVALRRPSLPFVARSQQAAAGGSH